jgi:hydroxylamine reductase (hybrid-cluster protein)
MSSNELRKRKDQASNFVLYTTKEVLEKLYTQTTLEEIGNTVFDLITKINVNMKQILETGYENDRMIDFIKVFSIDIEEQVKAAISNNPVLSNSDDLNKIEETGKIIQEFREKWTKAMEECRNRLLAGGATIENTQNIPKNKLLDRIEESQKFMLNYATLKV